MVVLGLYCSVWAFLFNSNLFISNWRIIALQYCVGPVDLIHGQCESVAGIHMYPPSQTCLSPPTPSHPSRLSQSTRFELPASNSKSPLAIYFYIEQCVCSSAALSIVPPRSLPAICFLCPRLRGCPLAVMGGSSSLVWCRLLSAVVSLVAEHGLSCRTACGVVLDQGSNPCPLHWQVIPNHWTTREVQGNFLSGEALTHLPRTWPWSQKPVKLGDVQLLCGS